MTRTLLLACVLPLAACGDKDDTAPPEGDTDTDTDADGDTDADSDADADTDADSDPDWAHCPEADSYVGDPAWTAVVEVTGSAIYCGAFNESRSLEQELEAKALLKLVRGSYLLPASEGSHELALPFCVRRAEGVDPQQMDGAGSTEVSVTTWTGTSYTSLAGSQPASDGSAWQLDHSLRLVGKEGAAPDPLLLDGGPGDLATGAGGEWALHELGGSAWDLTSTLLQTCADPSWHNDLHRVVFEGGEVTLELVLGLNTVATAPGRFTRASGELDGQAFEVEDYFRLIYRPEHHHFVRHFALIFDAPIGDACGLRIEEVDPWSGDPTAQVSTVDCALQPLEVRAVSEEEYVSDKYG